MEDCKIDLEFKAYYSKDFNIEVEVKYVHPFIIKFFKLEGYEKIDYKESPLKIITIKIITRDNNIFIAQCKNLFDNEPFATQSMTTMLKNCDIENNPKLYYKIANYTIEAIVEFKYIGEDTPTRDWGCCHFDWVSDKWIESRVPSVSYKLDLYDRQILLKKVNELKAKQDHILTRKQDAIEYIEMLSGIHKIEASELNLCKK